MTTTIEYEAFLTDDYPAADTDAFGYARLRDKARNLGLQLIGDVTRVYEAPAVAVPIQLHDGTTYIQCVEATDPAAVGKTPDARLLRWSIQAKPFIATEAVKVKAALLGEGALARGVMPPDVADQGGLVELAHGLGGEVTITAHDANGDPVGYSYGVPIDDDTTELLLPPGVARLDAVRDPDEDEEGTR